MNKFMQNNNKEHTEKGTQHLVDVAASAEHVRNNHQNVEKSYFSNIIKLEVGKTHK